MRVLGHRGARLRALENTAEALRVAYEEGADGVEFDVQVSADGEPVLFHDDRLLTMAGVDARVADLRLRDLRALEVRDAHGRSGGVDHLDVALELLHGRGGVRNLELKVVDDAGPLLVDAVTRRLQATFGADGLEGWVVSSFDRAGLERFAAQGLQVELAALVDDAGGDYKGLAGAGHRAMAAVAAAASGSRGALRAVHPHQSHVDAARLELWRGAGWAVRPWTVNDPALWTRAREAGVDALITDDPGALRAFLDRAAP